MRLMFLLLSVPLAVILLVFAIANRQGVGLDLWPLPIEELTAPAGLIAIVPFLAGILVGALLAWLQAAGSRKQSAERQRKVTSQEREIDRLRRQLAELLAEKDTGKPTGKAIRLATGEDSLTALPSAPDQGNSALLQLKAPAKTG